MTAGNSRGLYADARLVCNSNCERINAMPWTHNLHSLLTSCARFVAGIMLVLAVLAMPAKAQVDPADAVAKVEALHAGLEQLMANGQTLGTGGSAEFIGSVVDTTYFLPGLTAQSIGPSTYRGYDEAEQALVVDAYRSFVVANYVSRFAKPLPISFESGDVEPGPGTALIVNTLLNRSSGDPVQLSYVVVASQSGEVGITDVLYDGVSEAARRRSELSSLARQSAQAVADALRKKSAQIVAGGP